MNRGVEKGTAKLEEPIVSFLQCCGTGGGDGGGSDDGGGGDESRECSSGTAGVVPCKWPVI